MKSLKVIENLDRQKSATEQVDEKISTVTKQFDTQLSSMRRNVRWWGFLGLIAMCTIIVVSVIYIANLGETIRDAVDAANFTGEAIFDFKGNDLLSADYLAIVIPVLVAFAGALLTFLGMSRLKMFDERIDKIRKDMLDEIKDRVAATARLAKEEFVKEHREKLDAREKEMEMAVKKGIAELKCEHQTSAKSFQDLAHEVEQNYGWLKPMTTAGKVGDLNIATVADAHSTVETLCDQKPNGYVLALKKIVNKVCTGDGITSGDADDYHNLASELANGDMYREAVEVVKSGLRLFEKNTDLLADLIKYATQNSRFEDAEKAIERLQGIDARQWTWRCYEFIVDYYRALGNLEAAYTMCQKGIEALPYNEFSYRSKAELEQMLTPGEKGVEQAIATLEDALQKEFPAAQCAFRLSGLYHDKGEYQKAIDAASRSIIDSAQDQPPVSIAAVIARRGFAYEKLSMKKQLSGESDWNDLAASAVADYKMALGLEHVSPLSPVTIRQIASRLAILGQGVTETGQNDAIDA